MKISNQQSSYDMKTDKTLKTYFCRHSSALDIDKDTFDRLWNEDYIAIHYPWTKVNTKGADTDTKSTTPDEYETAGKRALNVLKEIEENGGYIFADYKNQKEYKIGIIKPGTKIELIKGKWGSKDREAILKGLKFSETKTLPRYKAISLICAQPRQGTLCRWGAVMQRVENFHKGISKIKDVGYLPPYLQEVMCSEYLRNHSDKKLPKLISLLTPVGRTMKDIDIAGLNEDGRKIFAQVTYSNEKKVIGEKFDKLKEEGYGNHSDENILILFCKDKTQIKDNVIIYSIEEVFSNFKESDFGKKWLESIMLK